jgi:hypothetical protein
MSAYGCYVKFTSRPGQRNALVEHLLSAGTCCQYIDWYRQQWAERTVRAVSAALPPVDHGAWPKWEQLLAHALICSELIEQKSVHMAEATNLLQQTGSI